MWKNCYRTLPSLQSVFLFSENTLQQQIRTTFILKRRTAPYLHKKEGPPKRLRSKHYVYDLVQDTDTIKQSNIEVILTDYVEGTGVKGEKVSVKPNYAYNHLLLPGLAVYATPSNVEKYKKFQTEKDAVQHSSPTAQRAVNILSRMTLSVVMNKEVPWTLKPWHIKASFRKCGYQVPEDAITLPSIPIEGPNMDIENKEFFVTVTVNKTEKVQVCCRIHHWSTIVVDRLPYDFEFWKKPSESILQDSDHEIK